MAIPLLRLDDIVDVRVVGRLFDQQMVNTFHYRVTNPSGVPFPGGYTGDMTNLFSELDRTGGFLDCFLDCVSMDYVMEEVQLQPIAPVRYAYQWHDMQAKPGKKGKTLTPNVDCVVTAQSAFTKRWDKRDLFLPGLPTTAQLDGYLTALYTDSLFQPMATIWDLVTPSFANSFWYQPICLHHKEPANSSDIIGWKIQPEVRVRRRRTVGLGK